MVIGEKLVSLECMIHDFARKRLSEANLDATLSELVMGNVYRRFQESAYHASLLNQLVQADPKKSATGPDLPKVRHETCEGTVEEFKEDLKKHGLYRKEE